MFLKSLEIYGFKSFSAKTKFEFKPGVTAIVGPNGCGKSNVVDALRWVLGEANARSLRGEIMDDVIFSGSEERKPLGMAEVGITIVNDDELLPVEYSEVGIVRRLYRSGESEFFINKNNVRLKDIHELFADTGIGKTAYSIMEQGNIDLILSNKPEERMSIFEEAAGITRYKLRMKQSYKKLAATEENLLRVNLIISEVEKEYNSLQKQAEKALEYKKLKKQELEYETLYNYLRVKNLQNQVEKNSLQLQTLKRKKVKLETTLTDLNNSIKEQIEKVRTIENKIADIKNEIYKKEAELEAINSKSEHIKDRIYEIKNEIAKKNHLKERIRSHKAELEEKIDHLSKDKASISELLISQEEKLTNYRKEVDYINDVMDKCSRQVEKDTEKIEKIEEAVRSFREALKDVIDRLLKEIDGVKANFKGNEKRKNDLIKKVNDSITNIDNTLRHHGTKLKDISISTKELDRTTMLNHLIEELEQVRSALSILRTDVGAVIRIQDDLSRVIFGKESMHSRKEQIERSIDKKLKEKGALKKEIDDLNEELKKNSEKKEKFSVLINELLPDIARNREKQSYFEGDIKRLRNELDRSDESLQDVEFDVYTFNERIKGLESELRTLALKYRELEEHKIELNKKTKGLNALIDRILDEIQHTESEVNRIKMQIDERAGNIEKIELNNVELTSRIETISENFKDRYGTSLELLDSNTVNALVDKLELQLEFQTDHFNIKSISERRDGVKKEISALGQVNLIAIEEFNEVKKRYEYLITQKEDLEKAKEDINLVMSKTVTYSKELFMESFEKIGRNFNGIFRRLFNGGKTDLYLINEDNIFESGVEIMACPPGKSLRRRSLLSGGEKGLTAIALLFAIFMVKPSPFCMLDEVDHDLDEENVLRFIKLLKEFTETTQFIIITHNRRTIEFADIIYGITMEEAGVSKVVSLDLVEQAIE